MSTRQLAPEERPWIAFVAAGAVFILGYELVASLAVRDVAYLVLGACAPIAIVVGVRRQKPALTTPWYLMAAGQALWVMGDAIYTWLEDVKGLAPFPSLADVFYLAAYPVVALGILLLVRGRRAHRDPAGLLDGAIVTAGLGLLSWVVLAKPTIAWSKESFSTAAIAVSYPLADIVLVAVLMLLVTSSGGVRSTSMRLLLGAIFALIVADSLYLAFDLAGIGDAYRVNALFLLSYLLWGASALHPSMTSLSRPAGPPTDEVGFRRTRAAAMTVAALIAPTILVVEQLAGTGIDVLAVAIGSVVIVFLVVARMRYAIRQIATAKSQLEFLQRELAHAAAHDSLTELPNRGQLMTLLRSTLNRAQRRGDLVAVLFVDLDGFKAVNDTHGHPAGDQVLREISQRLRNELRAGDTAARLGGDEFVVVLDPVEDEGTALTVAQRIIASISRPIPLPSRSEVSVSASVGVAFNHDAGTDEEALMSEADIAVYRAKAAGRGRAELFSHALGRELARTAELETAIVNAIDHDELTVHYQPIVELRTGRLIGHEALVRWARPDFGLLPPSEFIPTAEGSELICDVDTWVLHDTLNDLSRRNNDDEHELLLSVNLSGRHLNSGRAMEDVRAALEATGINPRRLVLEITETVLVQDYLAAGQLDELRELGVRLALDDFGSGYSTFAQLSRLPVDWIKIDRSFTSATSDISRSLLELMVETAHAAGVLVVAEGVEQPEQLEMLEQIGVDAAQGFLLGRPGPLLRTPKKARRR